MNICCRRWVRLAIGGVAIWCGAASGLVAAPSVPYLVKDINAGDGDGTIGDLTDVNGTLFFHGFDGVDTGSLWKSNGTAAGTVLVSDDEPNGVLKFLTNLNGRVFFLAEGGPLGEEMWVSDGTPEGTFMPKDIYPGPLSALPRNLFAYNDTLLFDVQDGVHGFELWRSDGTETGTVMVKDINPGSGNSSASGMVTVNGMGLFSADDGTHGAELWKTDGTEAGTVLVKDINPGIGSGAGSGVTIAGNSMSIFPGTTSSQGSELWRTDGTEAGTSLIKDINPGAVGADPRYLTSVDDMAFFQVNNGPNKGELWKSDGTEAGTVLVKDINPLGIDRDFGPMFDVNGTLFLLADDGTHGTELWKSDGTEAGTQMVVDLVPGSGSPGFFPAGLMAVNEKLLFAAAIPNAGRNDHTLFVSDGTAEGTEPVFTVPGIKSSTLRITDLEYTGTHLFFRAPLTVDEDGVAYNFELFAISLVPTATLLGDFNGNSAVDAADYTVWRNHMGTSFDLGGNGNEIGDSAGIVDMADYATWKVHYGESLPELSEGSSTTIPEPTSGLLWIGTAIALMARRRNRRG
jgi:ELWxxDGT repeat protein